MEAKIIPRSCNLPTPSVSVWPPEKIKGPLLGITPPYSLVVDHHAHLWNVASQIRHSCQLRPEIATSLDCKLVPSLLGVLYTDAFFFHPAQNLQL